MNSNNTLNTLNTVHAQTIGNIISHSRLIGQSLTREDASQAVLLALMTAQIEGIALLTDGIFGLTRSGSSTCEILGFTASNKTAYKAMLSHITSVCRYDYDPEPDPMEKGLAKVQAKQSAKSLRREIASHRNRELREAKSLILQAYRDKSITHKQCNSLLAKLAHELPPITAGRDLFKMLSYWGFVSHTINGPAPLYAQIA